MTCQWKGQPRDTKETTDHTKLSRKIKASGSSYGSTYRIIQRIKHAGATLSGIKSSICVETADIVGHKCTIDGRMPSNTRVQKIMDWPVCEDLTQVRGFLGTLGTIRIFFKDFAKHAKPLVQLMRKEVPFEFGVEQLAAMETLKALVRECSAIKGID